MVRGQRGRPPRQFDLLRMQLPGSMIQFLGRASGGPGRTSGGDVVFPPRRSSRQQDRPRTYQDKRAWQKRALLAQYLGRPVSLVVHLRDGADIEGASQELSEGQRLEVSVGSDLDEKAPFTRVLDFMGHVLLVAASGMDSGKGVLEEARRLLGATGDVVAILDNMRSLVTRADLRGLARQKFESGRDIGDAEEASLLAGAPHIRGSAVGAGSGLQRTTGRARPQRPSSSHVLPSGVLGGGQELLRPKRLYTTAGVLGVLALAAVVSGVVVPFQRRAAAAAGSVVVTTSAPGPLLVPVGNVQVQGPSHSLVHIREGIEAGDARSGGGSSGSTDRIRWCGFGPGQQRCRARIPSIGWSVGPSVMFVNKPAAQAAGAEPPPLKFHKLAKSNPSVKWP